MMPTRRVTLRDDDAAFIDQLLSDDEERMAEQQRATHDYTLSDLRDARFRRQRIRKALHIKEDTRP